MTHAVPAQLLSFPGAEGAGKWVTGGRGTVATAPKVFEVTSLLDDGSAGTFRYACTNNSPSAPSRIIVFRVSGTIHLTSKLSLNRANTTIAGQTAPGGGICIADYPVTIGANNMIIRHMRFRLGDKNQNLGMVNGSGDDDAFGDNGGGRSNIIIDHCSVSWSSDEALTIYKGDNVTLQWNFITEPLNYSYHFETGDTDYEHHAYGGIQSGKHMSIHHNLYAHCKGRMPRFDGIRNASADSVDFRNNVLYNWGDYNVNGGEGGAYNVVNNYYKYGPATPNTSTNGVNRRNMLINPYDQASPAIPYGKYFLVGNYCDNSSAITNNNWKGAAFGGGTLADSTGSKVTVPFNCVNINMQTSQEAYAGVLGNAGASLPYRDTLDSRIVNDVKNRTGNLIDVQGGFPHGTAYSISQTAWPTLPTGTAPLDSDHDGMPDLWETQRGLNKLSAADMNTYTATTGYSNVETYLNGDTLTAPGLINTCVGARAVNSMNGGSWLVLKDTLYSQYNSAYYLVSTDTSNFVASILDNAAMGRFQSSYYTCSTTRYEPVSGKPYLNRNITIIPDQPSSVTAPVTIRIYISKAEFNALKTADPTITSINDLVVLKTQDNGCVTSLSGSFNVIAPLSAGVFGSYLGGYFIEFQSASFGTFFLAGKLSFPVPLHLLDFNARLSSGNVYSSWLTADETNVSFFQLERSKDGISFSNAGQSIAKNQPGINQYYLNDQAVPRGKLYYRLRIVNSDGSVSFSRIVQLNNESAVTLHLQPNPVKGNFVLTHPEAGAGAVINIFDMSGKRMLSISPSKGSQQTTINVSALSSGKFELEYLDQANRKVTPFIKQ